MQPVAMSYCSGIGEKPLLGLTIGQLFEQTATCFPNQTALVVRHQNLRYTYAELHLAVEECAKALMGLGIRKQDRVGVWAHNCAEWAILQYATASIGAILVNINPSYRLHELDYALRLSGCRALVIAPEFKSSNYTAMILELLPELHQTQPGTLCSKRLPQLQTVIRIGNEPAPGMFSWENLLELGNSISLEDLQLRAGTLEFDDPINIQYTSGTTGFPKGATLSHHNILNNAFFVGELMKLTEADRLVIPVPLYHCFGMVMGNLACLTHGATAIYPAAGFEPQAVLEAVQEEKATALHGVPTMFINLLEHPGFSRFDVSSLRTGIMAGAPCPVALMKKVMTQLHMAEVEIAYGMTETSPVSFQSRTDTPTEKRVGTVGTIGPHLEAKIVDPQTGQVVPVGTPGELCTRGYGVMLGYWDDPGATRLAIDEARWMHTGDLAVMDSEGFVNIVGRLKDMIIRGGEKISPREVEEFFHTHPLVMDVHVIGVPDQRYGEEVMAWVRLKIGQTTTEAELQAYCRGRIAHQKIPKYIKLVDDFPMTVTGKIQKYKMREISIRELGLEAADSIETA
ncbi:MAG: AMP-binding protein [Blastocatellia bacterium]|nr:AMP-binding protein [Blastocatellia bacterium]